MPSLAIQPNLSPALRQFLLLYVALYAAFGVASPFLPAFLFSRGVPPEQLGLILGAATALRLMSAPVAGHIGDSLRNLRAVLVVCSAMAALVTPVYSVLHGIVPLLSISLVLAVMLAPTTVMADALALAASSTALGGATAGRFEYGWVRGAGSAAFVAGILLSGTVVSALGLSSIVWLQTLLLAITAVAASRVPQNHVASRRPADVSRAGAIRLLRTPEFLTLLVTASLVLGSHAMHDTFAVIRWSSAGIGPTLSSLLWSVSVAAEVVMFFVLGPRLVDKLSPAGAMALAAIAGVVRWAAMAQSVDVLVLAVVQPLHGCTFALLHLACMRIIARVAPPGLEGTAQALYSTGAGAATAVFSFGAGALYARLGGEAFWFMAALCMLALPFAWLLRSADRRG